MRRAVGTSALVLGLLIPFVPLLVWAGSGQWRYPALVPQQASGRGLRLLVDPASEITTGLVPPIALAITV